MNFKRIFLLILDSLGVGEAVDANNYGDEGANTLLHIKENNVQTAHHPKAFSIDFSNT